jgi:hypothetical protein
MKEKHFKLIIGIQFVLLYYDMTIVTLIILYNKHFFINKELLHCKTFYITTEQRKYLHNP